MPDLFKIKSIAKRGYLVVFLFFFFVGALPAQNQDYARKVVKKLSAPSLHGRGYVKQGDKKAALYLRTQFQKQGLKPLGDDYFQTYSFSINSFPSQMQLTLDGKVLEPGTEYIIWPSAKSMDKQFKLLDIRTGSVPENTDLSETLLLIDAKDKTLKTENRFGSAGVITLNPNKPIWNASKGRKLSDYLVIDVQEKAWKPEATELEIKLKNQYFQDYQTQNVVGFIPGNGQSDSLVVLTAHYDHLGHMGKKTYYPGANDNASGVAMILDLAGYFAQPQNKLPYNLVVIALSGEEVGLMGATYFANHPLIDLKKIKALFNLDMVATGSQGITVVNGKQLPQIYERLKTINQEKGYLKQVKIRGESCNSDHCPFYQKGVPAVFIYTMGKEYGEYHNPNDKYVGLPFTEYDDLFRLLRDFIQSE